MVEGPFLLLFAVFLFETSDTSVRCLEFLTTEESLRGNQELLDNDLIIILDKDLISLDESITDNLLLEIPLQIFAEDEEAEELPAGKFWSVLSEEDYAKQQEEKLEEKKSPFDALNGLFD